MSVKYSVKLTNTAIEQLREVFAYISKILREPEIARNWSNKIQEDISSLEHMPFRYPLIDEEPWKKEGIRKMSSRNFIIYYWINNDTSTVWVTAVVYSRRDQIAILRNMPKE